MQRTLRRRDVVWCASICRTTWIVAMLASTPAAASAQAPADTSARQDRTITPPDSTWLVGDSAARRCLDSLSDASLRAVTVYQIAQASDTSQDVLAQVALISQQTADAVRAALGGGAAASADTVVDWRHLSGPVPIRIVLHRDTATTWEIDHRASAAKAKLTALYAQVLRALPADQLAIVWPEHLAADSVTMFFGLMSVESATKPLAIPGHPMISVFVTRGVGFVPAMVRRDNPYPRYPADAVGPRVEADVIADIVVRANGRADGTVASVVIGSRRGPMASDARDHYGREFMSAVQRILPTMRFDPARIGGCAVPQRAAYPFTFTSG